MADEFNPGDLVRVKSGGPLMTVMRVEPPGHMNAGVEAVWFSRDNEFQAKIFVAAALERDQAENISPISVVWTAHG